LLDDCCDVIFTEAQVNLRDRFRILWEQHDVWTREVINGIVFELPNLEFTTARLLRNPVDMAKEFGRFYGPLVQSRLEELFTEHLVLAAELVVAAKAGDNEAVEDTRRRWYENGDDLARFLSSINPFWSYRRWLELIFHHLDLVEKEAVFLLTERFEENIAIYDEIEEQSLVMADFMAMGIINQFCFS